MLRDSSIRKSLDEYIKRRIQEVPIEIKQTFLKTKQVWKCENEFDFLYGYYVGKIEEGAPYKEKLGEALEGQKIIISGQVLNQNCDPIPEAIIDVWHTDSNGNYYFQDFTLRGKIKADETGQYKLETRFPGKYSEAGLMRPAHIHVKVSAPNLSSHTTQLYFEGDEHLYFFVKPSLILKLDERNGTKYSEFDFVIFTP